MNKIIAFVKESWAELKQVSWLTVPQVIASTWLVIILCVVMAAYVLVIDKSLQIFLGVVMP